MGKGLKKVYSCFDSLTGDTCFSKLFLQLPLREWVTLRVKLITLFCPSSWQSGFLIDGILYRLFLGATASEKHLDLCSMLRSFFSAGNLDVGISPKIVKTDKIEFKPVKSENIVLMQRNA